MLVNSPMILLDGAVCADTIDVNTHTTTARRKCDECFDREDLRRKMRPSEFDPYLASGRPSLVTSKDREIVTEEC